ncbi:MAG: bifunctional DNA-formamidopyrimidine glycosylase/DNA-(apurinic or apyrimidinic site) lyase [Pelagibacterales bacterium]|nr:bifunctional DNA-formamidopyrimidine glycosylase/DNA-(apurinic or apyrimidinic site) lyase [Pelagibacterales bacterium]
MPELPEVETVIRGISSRILSQTINKCELSSKKLRYPITINFKKIILSKKIISISRRAKYILINLNNNKTIVIHLGMSGRIILTSNNENLKFKHTHMTIYFTNNLIAKFIDPRRFGCVLLLNTNDITDNKLFNHLGPEPLGRLFNPTYLQRSCKNKKATIKSIIMNQSIVVGVGNIYASESLFLSGINPQKKAANINFEQCLKLVRNIKLILNRAIKLGGSSINDYSMVNGMLGYFQNELKVYEREGENCIKKTCNGRILRIVIAQRSTYYCSQCQKN